MNKEKDKIHAFSLFTLRSHNSVRVSLSSTLEVTCVYTGKVSREHTTDIVGFCHKLSRVKIQTCDKDGQCINHLTCYKIFSL